MADDVRDRSPDPGPDLRSDEIEVLGQVSGRIETKALRFGPRAKARGVFFFESLVIEEGAVVDGSFNVDGGAASSD